MVDHRALVARFVDAYDREQRAERLCDEATRQRETAQMELLTALRPGRYPHRVGGSVTTREIVISPTGEIEVARLQPTTEA